MAQPAVGGVPSTSYSAYLAALTNPSVLRLADALQIDLQDATQVSAIVSLAHRIHMARLPSDSGATLARHPYADADGQASRLTADYVARALIAYREMDSI